MNRERRRRLGRVPLGKVERFTVGSFAASLWPRTGGVNIKDREGVYVHSFMCNHCGLHFNIYSWLSDRHRSATIRCPECGQDRGEFRHFWAQISEDASGVVNPSHPGEIFRHVAYPGASLMDDTTTRGLVERPTP